MQDRIPFPWNRWGTVPDTCHPGLYLDKLVGVAPVNTEQQGKLLDEVLKRTRTGQGEFGGLVSRRRSVLDALGAQTWTRTTAAPMSLHLSRANAFENAGICLHRTYGFAYIPGSGLKGMARAWAEAWWLPQQPNKQDAWRRIEDVFGWGDTKERREQIASADHPAAKRTRMIREDDREREIVDTDFRGAIVFHDAWPTNWPVIEKDILACHHNEYYKAKEEEGVPAPGDWESPNLVSFLAVKAGTDFQFALGKALAGVSDELLQLARTFLDGALTDLGAGAKTNAGYGVFKPLDHQARNIPNTRKRIEVELELVTPAFLAGARQKADDCDLRGATLRGQLRWWWRTMHAAHLDPKNLRTLESLIWGSSKQGGAVAVRVRSAAAPKVAPFNRNEILGQGDKRDEVSYRTAHHVNLHERTRDHRKITPGLQYVSYGNDDIRDGQPRTRFIACDGAKWTVCLDVREAFLDVETNGQTRRTKVLSIDRVRAEVDFALRLLVRFGGVGSKSSNGFGSLGMGAPEDATNLMNSAKQSAAETRGKLGTHVQIRNVDSEPRSASLEQAIMKEVETKWNSPLGAIHQIGYSLSLFAANHAHKRDKRALGLPRSIGRPESGTFDPPANTVKDRHSSPWKVSLHRNQNGDLIVTYLAMPVSVMPSMDVSVQWIMEHANHFSNDMMKRAQHGRFHSLNLPNEHHGGGPQRPAIGSIVTCILQEIRTNRGGWKAAPETHPGWVGLVQNSNLVPADKVPGDRIDLVVTNHEPAFRVPDPNRPTPPNRTNPRPNQQNQHRRQR